METAWQPGPARPRAEAGTVDVWRVDLARDGERERALLSEGERERAARFADPEHGRRWARAHAVLRALLGAYVDTDPGALRFRDGPHGKPRLAGAGALRFNLSHAGGLALVAVAGDREVGVDVELPRGRTHHVAVVRRILGDAEAARLETLDPQEREREFLRAWVRWEAVLKCRGTGIAGADRLHDGPEPWVVQLDAGPPAAAALAVERGPVAVRCLRWPAVGA